MGREMFDKNGKLIDYKIHLINKKKAIERKLVKQQKRVDKLKFRSPKWWIAYKKWNAYRQDLKQVESRLKNKNKPHEGLQELSVITENKPSNNF